MNTTTAHRLRPAELAAIRADFPLLRRTVRGGSALVYLDSAATSQKPTCVIEAEEDFYRSRNAAVHRGAHELAEESTALYELARARLAEFIGVSADEVVWTKNATEGLNLLAHAFITSSAAGGDPRFTLAEGDEIVVTRAEHHANLVPWQQVAARTGARLRWLDVTPEGRIDLDTASVINDRTRIVACTHISNVTGAISPVDSILAAARAVDAITVLDACQSAPHIPLNLHALGVDFAVLSGHKMLGPTGVGALYGRSELLATMPPFLVGGSMVETVSMSGATYAPPPLRFEAGTQMVAQTVGLTAAVDYLAELDMKTTAAYEEELTAQLLAGIRQIPGVRVLGPTDTQDRIGTVAFSVDGVHPHDVGQLLDDAGIAIRVGHHCAQPLHRALGAPVSARASLAVYNSSSDIDAFLEQLARVRPFFRAGGA